MSKLRTFVLGILMVGAMANRPGEASLQQDAGGPVDIVIVGAGISGLAAALEAGQAGARVRVVDMWSTFGGHGVASGGVLNMVGTPVQESLGIHDDPELAFRDFMRWGEDADPEWVRYYVENSRGEIYDWLTSMGVVFSGVGHNPGNSVPRVHRTQGRGAQLVVTIYRECLNYPNISFHWNHQVVGLEKRQDRVVGIQAQNLRSGERVNMTASAVILATGGFQSSLKMIRKFWPQSLRYPDELLTASGIKALGLGHALAQQAGAQLSYMDHQWNYPNGIPDPRYPNTKRGLAGGTEAAIWVNMQGRRFVDESASHRVKFPAVVNQETSSFWAIFDQSGRETFELRGTSAWDRPAEILMSEYSYLIRKAETIEALAAQARLPVVQLQETVSRYNAMVEKGKDQDFGRFAPFRSPQEEIDRDPHTPRKIERPPFYAIRQYPITRKSMGGVLIDSSTRVLGPDDRPIPGLYAVGEVTGFGRVNGKAGLEGTFLGPGIVTGRMGGRKAVAELSVRPAPAVAHPVTRRQAVTPGATVENRVCLGCHHLPSLVVTEQSGYDHFQRVHRVVMAKSYRCVKCHSELVPVKMDAHSIDRVAQLDSCMGCHYVQPEFVD